MNSTEKTCPLYIAPTYTIIYKTIPIVIFEEVDNFNIEYIQVVFILKISDHEIVKRLLLTD